MKKNPTIEYVKAAIHAADEKQGQDIVALDVRKQTSLTDYFLFVGATSHVHVRTLEDVVREKVKEVGGDLKRTDGSRGHPWRVLDYGDFIVHIMEQARREFYSIERLWGQAKVVSWKAKKAPAAKKKKLSKKKPKAKKKARKTTKAKKK